MNKSDLLPLICQEECAEVIQAISKVFRFGLHQRSPYTNVENKAELETEIGQLYCVLRMLENEWDLDKANIGQSAVRKAETFDKWNDYFDRKPE